MCGGGVYVAGKTQRSGDWDKEGHIRVHLNIEQKQFSQPTKEMTNTRPRGLRIWYKLLLIPALRTGLYLEPMSFEVKSWICASLKGQCHEIFDFRFFFLNQFPTSPWVSHYGWIFFKICGDICSSRCTIGVVDTGGKWKNLQTEKF
jgi:hypothetical protein